MNIFYELAKERALPLKKEEQNKNYFEKNGKYGSVFKCLKIESPKEAEKYNKPMGEHHVLECKNFSPYESKTFNYITLELAEILSSLIVKEGKKAKKFLIVGVGNEGIISDALGPKTADKIIVSRNIIKSDNFAEVSAISPSVFAKTGIESAEIIKNIKEIVKPDIVILIDVLTCNSLRHLGKAFQISTGGLAPGAGVKNFQKSINKEYLKVPVITLGSPLMIGYEKILSEAFVSENYKKTEEKKQKLVEVSENIYTIEECKTQNTKKGVNFEKLIEKYNDKFFVEKDIEFYIEKISEIFCFAINKAIHKNLSMEEIKSLITP